METPKYGIIIYWSAVDDAFIAEVPELAGCMADGKTYTEALQNAQVIVAEWLETVRELGRTIPQSKGKLYRNEIGFRIWSRVILSTSKTLNH